MPHRFFSYFVRLPFLLRILIIAASVILFFGLFISYIEPETYTTPFEGIWWAIITTSTVGYGDIVPKSLLGKVTAIILILLGAGLVSTYFIQLGKMAVTRQRDFLKGKIMFKGKNHTIIIGWNERAKEIIFKLLKKKQVSSIILIDQTLQENPINDYRIHFIQGNPNLDEILKKANITSADKVIITADQSKDEHHADMNTILSILAIKGLKPDITCIVEILTPEQIENAKRAGADKIVQSNRITSSIMMNCLTSKGMVDSLLQLIEQLDGSKIVYRSPASVVGKSFIEANHVLIHEGCLLLGIKRGEKTIINPAEPAVIKESDILLVINR
jgi:voltage-gated potassium channel